MKKDSKLQHNSRVISRSNSEPASILKGRINRVQRLPVQRKTAILNKENQKRCPGSPEEIQFETKTARMKVLGSHQRQNTEEPMSIQTEGTHLKQQQVGQVRELGNRRQGPCAHTVRKPALPNMQPNPVTKQVVMFEGVEKTKRDAAKERSAAGLESAEPSERGRGGMPQDSFELSFQDKLHRWECDRQLESMELGEFELLEQAAEELSFSSNSSFVKKVSYLISLY